MTNWKSSPADFDHRGGFRHCADAVAVLGMRVTIATKELPRKVLFRFLYPFRGVNRRRSQAANGLVQRAVCALSGDVRSCWSSKPGISCGSCWFCWNFRHRKLKHPAMGLKPVVLRTSAKLPYSFRPKDGQPKALQPDALASGAKNLWPEPISSYLALSCFSMAATSALSFSGVCPVSKYTTSP